MSDSLAHPAGVFETVEGRRFCGVSACSPVTTAASRACYGNPQKPEPFRATACSAAVSNVRRAATQEVPPSHASRRGRGHESEAPREKRSRVAAEGGKGSAGRPPDRPFLRCRTRAEAARSAVHSGEVEGVRFGFCETRRCPRMCGLFPRGLLILTQEIADSFHDSLVSSKQVRPI